MSGAGSPPVSLDVEAGGLAAAFDATLERFVRERFGPRLRERDASLWPLASADAVSSRLGWVDLPDRAPALFDDLTRYAVEVAASGVDRIVLLGMGGSSLAPEVFQATLGHARARPRLTVVDTTHPHAVARIAGTLDLGRAHFVVASKSGGTVETLSLYRFFRAAAARDDDAPGQRFTAITDPGSPLERLAEQDGFRRVFLAPPDVGGRYSALSVFGLVPAALIGVDVRELTARAARALHADDAVDPAVRLGALLAAAAASGRTRLVLRPDDRLAALPAWIEQLVAESTGKAGRGILPVCDAPAPAAQAALDDRVVVALRVREAGGAPGSAPTPKGAPAAPAVAGAGGAGGVAADEAARGVPVAHMTLGDVLDLGAAFHVWEAATALAATGMDIDPFDQPDVQRAKDLARRALDGERVGPGADATTITGPRDLAAWLDAVEPGHHVGIHLWCDATPDVREAARALADVVQRRTRAVVTVGVGPRFLHSTGQLHKGGPADGHFLQVVQPPVRDIEIPGAATTFGALVRAQADGDLAALAERGRRVARVSADDPARTLRELAAA